jgi:hypothetical protein
LGCKAYTTSVSHFTYGRDSSEQCVCVNSYMIGG